jgi:hypothetical protein
VKATDVWISFKVQFLERYWEDPDANIAQVHLVSANWGRAYLEMNITDGGPFFQEKLANRMCKEMNHGAVLIHIHRTSAFCQKRYQIQFYFKMLHPFDHVPRKSALTGL